jgi:F-type H+-transporting ATPase subunit delta
VSNVNTYAQALVQAALGKWVDQLGAVQRATRRSPELFATLTDPNAPVDARERAVNQILPEQTTLEVKQFVRLLAREGDLRMLDEILRHVQTIVPSLTGDDHNVVITSAHELSASEKERLQAKLAAEHGGDQELRIRYEVDPELLGGLRIQVGDRVSDYSVSSRLDALRARLVG